MSLVRTTVELACVGTVAFDTEGAVLVAVRLCGGPRPGDFRVLGEAPTGALASELVERFRAYDRGEAPQFEQIPLPAAASLFQSRVREALRATRLGETLAYGNLAARAGSPRASRAVGGALARNRWPLVVPCHRVLASAGKLGGFTGGEGAATKRALLAHEAHAWGHAP